jgi:hypothetical protein
LRLDFFVLFYQEKRTREKGIKRGDESLFMNWASFFSLHYTWHEAKIPSQGISTLCPGSSQKNRKKNWGRINWS